SRIVAGLLRRIAIGPRHAQSNQAPLPVLTNREREVVRCIVAGMSNKDIARRLNLAVSTVKSHVHNVLGKMELTTRGQLAPRLRPELVVIGLASGESVALVKKLLLMVPAALVIAFAEDGRRAVGYELRLHSTDLIDASPESLTAFILAAVASRLGPRDR